MRYVEDIAKEQYYLGHEVFMIFPSSTVFPSSRKVNISLDGKHLGVNFLKINNAAPPPLFHGVRSPNKFIDISESLSIKTLDSFYEAVKPDVFHIHSLMSLPLKLVRYLKCKGVKVIFTSHDYYGLCLRVSFVDYLGNICDAPSDIKCTRCNIQAQSISFLRARNLKVLLKLKKHLGRLKLFVAKVPQGNSVSDKKVESSIPKYKSLLSYYRQVFECVDLFHFNSSIAKDTYKGLLSVNNFSVLSVMHNGIKDNRVRRAIDDDSIRFGFIGPLDNYKGFPLLNRAFALLAAKGYQDWKVSVWGCDACGSVVDEEKFKFYGKFSGLDLAKVFDSMDVLIVPSIWKETFSLITLEALSYGVPVLVSEHVGAKDLLNGYAESFVFRVSEEGLLEKLLMILDDPLILEAYNNWILSSEISFNFREHVEELDKLYLR